MTGFDNPIIGGGGALVYPSIHSPDFVHNVSGWTINKDGTVEFNSGTFRGTITAGEFDGTSFIINGNGQFFYDGPPATGHLIASVGVVTQQLDPSGRFTVFPGSVIYHLSGAPLIQLNDGGILFYPVAPGSSGLVAPGLLAVNGGSGNDAIGMQAPQNTGHNQSALVLQSAFPVPLASLFAILELGNQLNTPNAPPTGFQQIYGDANSGSTIIDGPLNVGRPTGTHFGVDANAVTYWTLAGHNASAKVIAAGELQIQDGSGNAATLSVALIVASLGGVDETWHAQALAAGWAAIANEPAYSLRLAPDGNVQITGSATHANFAVITQLFNAAIPAAYRPANTQYIAPGQAGQAGLQIDGLSSATPGIVNAVPPAAGCTTARCNGTYPLNL